MTKDKFETMAWDIMNKLYPKYSDDETGGIRQAQRKIISSAFRTAVNEERERCAMIARKHFNNNTTRFLERGDKAFCSYDCDIEEAIRTQAERKEG